MAEERMAEVFLNVYDVTSCMNVKANTAIVQLNKLMRDGMGVGGIFHGAIQVNEAEWSFGYCEHGTGVFSCPPKGNPMYTYRETVPLGRTTLSPLEVNQILTEMSKEWQGCTYDLLARNCNHFCEVFCARLGGQKLPLWVNRFAKTGDVAVEVAGDTVERFQQVKEGVVSAGRVAYRYLFGDRPATSPATSPDPESPDSRSGRSGSSRRFTFSRTPSERIVGETSSDGPAEERTQTENDSKVQIERSITSLLSFWKEPSLRKVEEQEPAVRSVQEPKT